MDGVIVVGGSENFERKWVVEIIITNVEGKKQYFTFTTKHYERIDHLIYVLSEWAKRLCIEG